MLKPDNIEDKTVQVLYSLIDKIEGLTSYKSSISDEPKVELYEVICIIEECIKDQQKL